MNNIWILAQAQGDQEVSSISSETVAEQGQTMQNGASEPNSVTQKTSPKGFNPTQLVFLVLIFVMMYLILFRGPRKKQQRHKQMVRSLQKNDRVQTIGGIIGTIVDIKDDEITLKVDESNNTKIKIASSAIGKNLSKDKDR